MDYLDRLTYSTGDYFEDNLINKEGDVVNMSMIAKDNGGMAIPPLENGVYIAICSGLIDLGIQVSEQFGTKSRKMIVQWIIAGETIDVNGEQLPRSMHKQYGFSIGSKSNLRKDLEAWRGRAFTDEELNGFDLKNILNVPCQMQIITKERVGKSDVNNISGIMSLPKGNNVDKLNEEDLTFFDIEDTSTYKNFERIPKWVQEVIKQAENYESSGLKKYVEENVKEEVVEDGEFITVEDTDDLPF